MDTAMIVLITVGGSALVFLLVAIVYTVAGNEKKRKAEAEKAAEATELIEDEAEPGSETETEEGLAEEENEDASEEVNESTEEIEIDSEEK